MTIVENKHGAEIDFDAAVQLMDDDLREMIVGSFVDDAQKFFSAYEKLHEAAYGTEWELSKENPNY